MSGIHGSQKCESALNVSQHIGTEKKCKQCGETKKVEYFHKEKRVKDGLDAICILCARGNSRKYLKEYRQRGCVKLKKQAYAKQYYEKNKVDIISYTRQWRKENPDKVKLFDRISHNRNMNNPQYRVANAIRGSIWHCLVKKKNNNRTESAIGYKIDELVKHLEKRFASGMNWKNYGNYWEIDHIIPISAFNFETINDVDFKLCWSLGNLRPLVSDENRKKKDKLFKPFQPSLTI
jgi:hypothetical protein